MSQVLVPWLYEAPPIRDEGLHGIVTQHHSIELEGGLLSDKNFFYVFIEAFNNQYSGILEWNKRCWELGRFIRSWTDPWAYTRMKRSPYGKTCFMWMRWTVTHHIHIYSISCMLKIIQYQNIGFSLPLYLSEFYRLV